jgi:hypothetical protein
MKKRERGIYEMGEFICGFLFFAAGAGLLIHNKTLVERAVEFERHLPEQKDGLILFNRILCVLAGLVISWAGFMTMLSAE